MMRGVCMLHFVQKVHRQSSRCQQMLQAESTEDTFTEHNSTFQLLNSRQQLEQQRLQSILLTPYSTVSCLINHSLISISLHPDNIFPSILGSSVTLPPIVSLLFWVIKFEQHKGWLSVCAAKQIDHPLISQPHSWQCSEVSERQTAWLRGTFLKMSQLIVTY